MTTVNHMNDALCMCVSNDLLLHQKPDTHSLVVKLGDHNSK